MIPCDSDPTLIFRLHIDRNDFKRNEDEDGSLDCTKLANMDESAIYSATATAEGHVPAKEPMELPKIHVRYGVDGSKDADGMEA